MNVKTKYKIGDKIFEINLEEKAERGTKCVVCKGSRVVNVVESNRKFTCPVCLGTGYEGGKVFEEWVVEPIGKIDEVNICILSRKIEIVYTAGWCEFDESDEAYFSGKNVAQAECDRRNKKIRKKKK